MSEMFEDFKPADDLGHSADDDMKGYEPGMGAMVAMGYEHEASVFPMDYAYGPGVPPGYPHGPFDEPQMGWEHEGRREEHRGMLHGAWRDHRPWWKRLFNRPMAPEQPVIAPPGYPAAPYATPPAEMGFGWEPAPPAPPAYGSAYGRPAAPETYGHPAAPYGGYQQEYPYNQYASQQAGWNAWQQPQESWRRRVLARDVARSPIARLFPNFR